MEEEENRKTREMLDLALEVICLLTGEDYIVIKKALVTNIASSRLPLVPEGRSRSQRIIMEPHPSRERNNRKILKVIKKMMEVLMSEEQRHGGHEDLEKDNKVDNWQILKTPADSQGRGNHLNTLSLDLQMINSNSCSTEESNMAPCPDVIEEHRRSGSSAELHAQTEPSMKEEIALRVEDGPVDSASHHIFKEESALCLEESPPWPSQCSTSDHIKEEPVSCDEGNLTDGDHISFIVKEEPDQGDDEDRLPMEEHPHTRMANNGLEMQSDHSKCYVCHRDVSPQELVHVEGGLYQYSACRTCIAYNATQRTTHEVGKSYTCSKCRKSFANNSHLIRHRRVHSGDKRYPCLECGKCFGKSSHLVRHQRVHTGDKPYSCQQCGRCFSNNSQLIIHQRVHTGDKPYTCDECGKSFSTKQNMDCHKRVHTGEKPFDCPVCKRSFAHKSAMIKHERIHTGERPYICGECEKGFVSKSELVKHQRTHTGEKPYECTECGKCFSRNYELGLHKKIHTGEKPHCCPQCGKWFLRKYEFILHERTHTGETPYSCFICAKRFSHRTNFSRHLSTHTSYNP